MIDAVADGTTYAALARHVAIGIAGLGSLAGVVSVLAAFSYRRVTTRSIPTGAAVLVGIAPIAVWVGVAIVQAGSILPALGPTEPASAGYLLGALGAGALVAATGRRLGDHLACSVYDVTPLSGRGEPESLVASARVTVVIDLPETIGTPPGYRPVDGSVERALVGRTLRFPRGCSMAAIEDRLDGRIARDFDVDRVEVSLDDDGTVTRLAVGRRRRGIGPTLPPGTVAVAIRVGPTPAAAPGDPVEVWSRGETSRLVATGRLRAAAGGVATVVVAEDDVAAFESGGGSLDAGGIYRLVARAGRPSDAHQFVSTLRTVAETVTPVSVESGGELDGEFVGWLPGTVLVIDRDESVLALPDDRETLRAGDRLWVLGEPDAVARLDAAGAGESVRASRTPETAPTHPP